MWIFNGFLNVWERAHTFCSVVYSDYSLFYYLRLADAIYLKIHWQRAVEWGKNKWKRIMN